MKAFAIWPKTKRSGVIDVDEPTLRSPTSVRLRMLDVGVCGTDAEICNFDYGTPPAGNDYLITGHEALGEVIEVGDDVSTLKVGDLVAPMVRRPCPHEHCAACRSGYQDFCITGDYTERGIKEAHGFLAEIVAEEERYLVALPGDLRDVGVLIEPLTIAEKALEQYADVQRRLPWQTTLDDAALMLGRTALVLGAGPVGLLGAMLLAGRGFTVIVYSRGSASGPKAKLIADIGAEYVSSTETTVDELVRRLGGVDFVYEAAGASQFAFDVLKAVGANGVFLFTGVPGRKQEIEIDGGTIMKNIVLLNQAVVGTVNAGRSAFDSAVRDLGDFARAWPNATRSIITHRHPMAGFCRIAGGGEGIKHVIDVAGAG